MAIKNLIGEVALYLSKIPGIGEKSGRRYAFWLAENKQHLENLIKALEKLLNNISICRQCFNITTNKDRICDICKDPQRDKRSICVVESIENIVEIEESNVYNGIYFVLGGVISPLNNIESVTERIDFLKVRVKTEHINEVILVLSSTTEGELTTQYIKEKLKETDVKITRVASGIPVGTNITYIDKKTLIEAFKARVVA